MRKKIQSDVKNTPKKRKKISVLHVVSFLFIAYFIYTLADQQMQMNKYDSQIDMYTADIENKNKLIEYYSKQISNVESDEYIENVARETLGYVKPYEKIFIDANR